MPNDIRSAKRTVLHIVVLTLVCLDAWYSTTVHAEIYKWVDANGKVHYSNKESAVNKANQQSVEKVKVRDQFVIPNVSVAEPIVYQAAEAPRGASIDFVKMELEGSSNSDFTLGQLSYGTGCNRAIPLYWNQGYADLQSKEMTQAVAAEFTRNGYSAEANPELMNIGGNLQIIPRIKNMKMIICDPKQSRPSLKNTKYNMASIYMKIEWTAYDTVSDRTFSLGSTEGSYVEKSKRAYQGSLDKALIESITMATTNLLAKQDIVANFKATNFKTMDNKFAEDISVDIDFSDSEAKFTDNVKSLKSSTVIVKTRNGHGSGVLISDDGYVLTNAHVVGNQEHVTIKFQNTSVGADVVRKHAIRDVALLKLENVPFMKKPVPVRSARAEIGEDIYVIGTPLSEAFSHTITRGIISANRTMNGIDFYQTDASINRGNSGGPAFDQYGRLIGLTVSGMFTRSGANLSINYLIPIDDALERLAINDSGDLPFKAQLTNVSNKLLNSGDSDESIIDSLKAKARAWLE